jgi:two-component system, NarL family, response regulator LiaR
LTGAGTRTIRLLVVDDRPTVRTGLRIWLALEPDLEVVGEASDGSEAISLTQALRPDVVLMDVEMPGMDGISATAALRSLAPRARW